MLGNSQDTAGHRLPWEMHWPHQFETRRFESARRFVERNTAGLTEIAKSGGGGGFHHYSASQVILRRSRLWLLNAASECSWDATTRCESNSVLSLHLLLEGAYEVDLDGKTYKMTAGDAIFFTKGSPLIKHHQQGNSQQLLMSFKVEDIERVIRDNFGTEVRCPIKFPHFLHISAKHCPVFTEMTHVMLHDLLSRDSIGKHPAIKAQYENILISLLLKVIPSNYSGDIAGAAIVSYLKRAENFIKHNFTSDIKFEDIVKASGVSSRAVQYGFREFRGKTPMQFLKETRLNYAREMICQIADKQSIPLGVQPVARKSGYRLLSQFSRDYKAYFGYPPSKTCASTLSKEDNDPDLDIPDDWMARPQRVRDQRS